MNLIEAASSGDILRVKILIEENLRLLMKKKIKMEELHFIGIISCYFFIFLVLVNLDT